MHLRKPTGRLSRASQHHQSAPILNQPASSQQRDRFTSSRRTLNHFTFTSSCCTSKATNISRDDEIWHENLLFTIGRNRHNANVHPTTSTSYDTETAATTRTHHCKITKKPQVQHATKSVPSKISQLNRTHPPNIKRLPQIDWAHIKTLLQEGLALDTQLSKYTGASGTMNISTYEYNKRPYTGHTLPALAVNKHSRKYRYIHM